MRVYAIALVAAATIVVAAGCGGSHHAKSSAALSCSQRVQARAMTRLRADLAVLRRVAARPTKNTLKGDAATSHATDRFLNDVETAPVDNLVRNRLIDHAAAAVVAACQQCFQALEAARPIPAIAAGDRGACSH